MLLPFFGLSMDLGPIAGWGLALDRHHVSIDPATCQTSLPGVFAIGDVVTYPGKLKLILQGFSEAAMAAHAIFGVVRPGQALHFEYSTTKGVPRTVGTIARRAETRSAFRQRGTAVHAPWARCCDIAAGMTCGR